MGKKTRIWLGLGFLGVLLTWPIVHMVLGVCCGLNSWKFAGWGMYASTQPHETEIKVFMVAEDGWPIPEIGRVIHGTFVVAVNGGQGQQLDLRKLAGRPDLPRLRVVGDWVRTVRRGSQMREIASILAPFATEQVGGSYPNSVVLLSEPRLNILDRYTYVLTSVYLNRGEQTRKIGVYRSDKLSEAEALAQINAKIQEVLVEMR